MKMKSYADYGGNFFMKKHFHSRSPQKKEVGFLTAVLIGTAFSLALGMILLALLCIPALALSDPLRFAPAFALSALFISAAAGAFLSAKLHGKSGLACGILTALMLIICLVALCFIFSLKIRTTLFFICAPALLLISAFFGLRGISEKAPKLHKHKPVKHRA